MTCLAAQAKRNPCQTDRAVDGNGWKKKVSETLLILNIVPEKFTGRVVIAFKEGGVSYLEKTETMK